MPEWFKIMFTLLDRAETCVQRDFFKKQQKLLLALVIFKISPCTQVFAQVNTVNLSLNLLRTSEADRPKRRRKKARKVSMEL